MAASSGHSNAALRQSQPKLASTLLYVLSSLNGSGESASESPMSTNGKCLHWYELVFNGARSRESTTQTRTRSPAGPKDSVDGPIAAQAELAEGCTVCPTWGKLYRNGHFGAHFGPRNLRFSGLSWGFKSLLLHHFTLSNQRLSSRICPIGRLLRTPIALQCQICAIGSAGREPEHTNWRREPRTTLRAIDFLLFEHHYRHRRPRRVPMRWKMLQSLIQRNGYRDLCPQVKPEVLAL